MSNDIVERLRGIWLPNDTPSLIRDEAADEILRLRDELTASHESHGNEVGALTERLSLAIHERDEARVDACRLEADARGRDARMSGMSCHYFNPKQIAKERGWDCFKEGSDERHC